MALSAHNEAEECLLLLFSINDHASAEEPMATVLTVRMADKITENENASSVYFSLNADIKTHLLD